MPKAVFFDAADTLFRARQPVARSYARLAREYGNDASEEGIAAGFSRAFRSGPGLAFGPGRAPAELLELERRWWRRVVAETFRDLGAFNDFDAYFKALFAFFADPASWQPMPEAIPTLQRLKKQGFIVGVISNFDTRLYPILDGLGLRPLLDSITISSEAGFAKPSPEIFRIALAKHEMSAEAAVHVGDSLTLDISGASSAGLKAVLFDPDCRIPPLPQGVNRVASLTLLETLAQGFS